MTVTLESLVVGWNESSDFPAAEDPFKRGGPYIFVSNPPARDTTVADRGLRCCRHLNLS
jgi:hypothetical protein